MSYDVALGRRLARNYSIGDAPVPLPDLSSSRRLAESLKAGRVTRSSRSVSQIVEDVAPEAVDFVRKYRPSYSQHVFSVKTKI